MTAISTNNLTLTKSKEIVLVGFKQSLFDLLTPPGNDSNLYAFTRIEQPFAVIQTLKDRLNVLGHLPYAIVCKLDFLTSDDFRMVRVINEDPELRKVPFIVIGTEGQYLSPQKALNIGIDDCYFGKVSWKDLHKRIEFLSRYKEDIRGFKEEVFVDEDLKYKIPLGKRLFDIVFASAVILAISPILLTVAALIKLTSKGPIIYKSKRIGTGYQVFDFLKFRSMVVDADAQLAKLQHLNHYAGEDGNNTFVKLKNDPRITWIGRIIRKTSIDELPQLFNVLRGEMSIVGNRPLPLYEAEQMTTDEWAKRFHAPAGITGLWQVCEKGKDNLTVSERVELDINYAQNYSFVMDAKILSRTLPAMIQKEE